MLDLPGGSATSTCHEGSPNRCSSRTVLATPVCRFRVKWESGRPLSTPGRHVIHPQEYLRLIRISTLLSQPKFTEQLHARIKELLRETLRLVNLITAPASLRVQRIRAFHNTQRNREPKGTTQSLRSLAAQGSPPATLELPPAGRHSACLTLRTSGRGQMGAVKSWLQNSQSDEVIR